MEQRGEVLDLPAADAELELAAAVQLDAALQTGVDALEQARERPEARRLDVEVPHAHRQRVDIRERVDRRIERKAVERSVERLQNVGVKRYVFEHRVGEMVGDEAVEIRVRHRVDRRAVVVGLDVTHAHATRRRERVHVRHVPLPRDGVDLELEARRDGSGAGWRPTTSPRVAPAWRSARSSAALSNAQRR